MKATIKTFLLLVTAAVCTTSCNDWLDEDPKYGSSSAVVFSNRDTAQTALRGIYAYLSSNYGYGQMWQEIPLTTSGITWGQRQDNDAGQLVQLTMQPANGEIYSAWYGMYRLINEANNFISGMATGSLPDSIGKPMTAEAYFLRALAYYNLTTTFGNVPLKTEPTSIKNIAIACTPDSTILKQIIADFQYAADNLPTASKDGYANAWAAKAYLGKVYWRMAMLDYDKAANLQKAKQWFDEVYNNGPFKLEADFAGLFGFQDTKGIDSTYTSLYVTGSKESIFQVNFSTDVANPDSYNRGSNRFAPTSSTSGICWGTFRVQKFMYDLHRGTYPGDPRMETTYLTHWRTRGGNSISTAKAKVGSTLCVNDSTYSYPYKVYTTTKRVPGARVTKLQAIAEIPYADFEDPTNPDTLTMLQYATLHPEADSLYAATVVQMVDNFTAVGSNERWPYFGKIYDQGQSAQYAHKNLMVYRYAEMLLLMADVYNELGKTDRAIELANEVLARARALGDSGQPAAWSTGLSQDVVREKLYFERLFELAGEPDVFDMTRCKGTEYLKKLLELNNRNEFVQGANAAWSTNPEKFADYLYGDNGVLTDDFLKKVMHLPIPQNEIDRNDGMTSADQNFGY